MSETTEKPLEGRGYFQFIIPVQLVVLQTSALDLLTDWVPGFNGRLIKMEFLTTKVGTGSGATQTISTLIKSAANPSGKAPTGGVLTLALADTTPTGKIKAATDIVDTDELNRFTKTDKLSVKVAASGTAFTAGDGSLILTLQNIQDT